MSSVKQLITGSGRVRASAQRHVRGLQAALLTWFLLALASAVEAGTLRWDAGLSEIGDTITGRVAAGVGVIGIGIVGISHMANADMGGAARGIVGVAIILGMVLAGKTFVNQMALTGMLLP